MYANPAPADPVRVNPRQTCVPLVTISQIAVRVEGAFRVSVLLVLEAHRPEERAGRVLPYPARLDVAEHGRRRLQE